MSRSSICFVAVFAATTLAAGSSRAQGRPPGVVADIEITVSTSTGQTYSKPGHYYRSKDGRTREDSSTGSIITDIGSGTVTLLNSTTKEATVISTSGDPRATGPTGARGAAGAAASQAIGSFVPFEQAQIEGHAVTKARANGASGRVQELWTATDLGLVVFSKVDSPDRTMTRTLRNVSLREPDPTVFQIPEGYTVKHVTGPLAPPGSVAAPPSPGFRP